MSKRVVINFGRGSFEAGFSSVSAELWETEGARAQQLFGSLPPAPEIITCYRDWKLLYNALAQRLTRSGGIEIEPASLTNISQDDLYSLCQRLHAEINYWLNAETFRKIDKKLRTWLSHTEEVRIVIETSDDLLWRLPWHLWEFVEDYPQSEVVLSLLESKRVGEGAPTSTNQLRVLAILGDSRLIDINADKNLLQQLPGIAPTFLLQPDRKIINDALWQQSWDILFFAGHSSSQAKDSQAKIYINQNRENHSLSINQLEYALSKAIKQGLQLAIFNSCDGLGLARQLAKLHIPQIIVMREDVPNLVAQEFLKYFLEELAQGKSLTLAVRLARERLQGLENEYPCASWLPVICQNSTSELPTWQGLQDTTPNYPPVSQPTPNRKRIFIAMLLVSFIVTSLVMGVRYCGWLQPSELHAFDHFMHMRSHILPEKPDDRFLIVTVDEKDLRYQDAKGMQRYHSLSDQALLQLLEKLEQYQPRTIGLDMYRDGIVTGINANLRNRFQSDDRLFTVCKLENQDDNGIPSPPGVPKVRQSFSDFVDDRDKVARRHLLNSETPATSLCTAESAFSLSLALHYLHQEDKTLDCTPSGLCRIGDVEFKQLKEHSSGYQKFDDKGYQILLNYRSLPSLAEIAEPISLRNILEDKISEDFIKSHQYRIILIGLGNVANNDGWETPYSAFTSNHQESFGVIVQAHMVSQIISAVLDKRPLLWWWNVENEAAWIWGWSLIGGIIAWFLSKPWHLGIGIFTSILAIYGCCIGIFLRAGWIPLIPALLGLFLTAIALSIWLKIYHKTSEK
ncbi:CHASE2 domain-containing protein [Calothrix sp. NIES-2100]|uniref:CHASE2 domain-containing protein n=1 Tax=Calothrix sp. NIES-2100 TaxID=1954172 RepID=UPI000BBC25BD